MDLVLGGHAAAVAKRVMRLTELGRVVLLG